MKAFIIAINLILLIPVCCECQNLIDNWYFGYYAGISFQNDTIESMTGEMHSAEGCASVSDGCGLLFYTDGDTVWNKNHEMMTNGFSIGGECTGYAGTQSATQSAIILRKPNSDSLFYVFTTDCHEDELVNGFRYSIIDMSKQGGLGEVELKNNYLHGPVGEKVTAAYHEDEKSIWVITHEYGSNGFYAYLLSEYGLDTVPVVSYSGQVHSGDTTWNNCNRGSLVASPNGEHLISVTPDGAYWYCDTILPELFSFDRSTGECVSEFVFPQDTSFLQSWSCWSVPFYGATFSPDNSKLYMDGGFLGGPHLYQYDISLSTIDEILESRILLTTIDYGELSPSQMAIGPDQKIYVAHRWHDQLGVIHEPNNSGSSCMYDEDYVQLDEGTYVDWGGIVNNFPGYSIPKWIRV